MSIMSVANLKQLSDCRTFGQATGPRADQVVPRREGIHVQVPSGDASVIVEGRRKDRKDTSKVSLQERRDASYII